MVDDQPKAKRILHKLYLSVLVPLLVVGVPLFLVGVVQVVHDRIVVGEDIQCVKENIPVKERSWRDSAKPKFDPDKYLAEKELEKRYGTIEVTKNGKDTFTTYNSPERLEAAKNDGFVPLSQFGKLKSDFEEKCRVESVNLGEKDQHFRYKRAWTSKYEMDYKDFYHEHIFLMSFPLLLAGILFAIRKWAIWLAK